MQDIQQSAPLCQVLNEDSTMRTMISLFVPHVRLDSQAIKLQCNAGTALAVSLSFRPVQLMMVFRLMLNTYVHSRQGMHADFTVHVCGSC